MPLLRCFILSLFPPPKVHHDRWTNLFDQSFEIQRGGLNAFTGFYVYVAPFFFWVVSPQLKDPEISSLLLRLELKAFFKGLHPLQQCVFCNWGIV